jgi:hypothetical protein
MNAYAIAGQCITPQSRLQGEQHRRPRRHKTVARRPSE